MLENLTRFFDIFFKAINVFTLIKKLYKAFPVFTKFAGSFPFKVAYQLKVFWCSSSLFRGFAY